MAKDQEAGFSRRGFVQGAAAGWDAEVTKMIKVFGAPIADDVAFCDLLGRHRVLRSAKNRVLCAESTSLADGDEVGFFPPVTGG